MLALLGLTIGFNLLAYTALRVKKRAYETIQPPSHLDTEHQNEEEEKAL